MKRNFCLMALLCLILDLVGQDPKKALTIGDNVPDVTISNIIHHPRAQIELSEFSGKLVIIDFWATWCAPCIAMLPKTDSLQKIFAGRVQFLPVTDQSKEKIETFWAKSKKLSSLSLPIVTDDKVFEELFPHQLLPHYVWISSEGKVIGITESNAVTAARISSALSGKHVDAPVKTDEYKPYSPTEPFLLQDLGISKDDIVYQSLFTKFVSGISSRMEIQRNATGKIRHIALSNAWVEWLFALAYSRDDLYFRANRISVEVSDRSKTYSTLSGAAFTNWLKDNSWCYELNIPGDLSLDAYELMRSDLSRFLPQYTATIEKRLRPCLVLERISKVDKLKSKGGEKSYTLDAFSVDLSNDTVMLLQQILAHTLQPLELPIIDMTSYKQTIDLHLKGNMSNLNEVRSELRKYDLDLVPKDHEIEVLVIRDSVK